MSVHNVQLICSSTDLSITVKGLTAAMLYIYELHRIQLFPLQRPQKTDNSIFDVSKVTQMDGLIIHCTNI
jgi:hypothetical protein